MIFLHIAWTQNWKPFFVMNADSYPSRTQSKWWFWLGMGIAKFQIKWVSVTHTQSKNLGFWVWVFFWVQNPDLDPSRTEKNPRWYVHQRVGVHKNRAFHVISDKNCWFSQDNIRIDRPVQFFVVMTYLGVSLCCWVDLSRALFQNKNTEANRAKQHNFSLLLCSGHQHQQKHSLQIFSWMIHPSCWLEHLQSFWSWSFGDPCNSVLNYCHCDFVSWQ